MYNRELPTYGDLISVQDFKEYVRTKMFIDYDGHGNPVKNNLMSNQVIKPSRIYEIPEDATHIMWFNK